MERFDFSKGHITIDSGTWMISINGVGVCGRSKSRDQAMKDILNHWKISGKLKDQIAGIFNKIPVVSGKIGNQLELF